MCARRGGSQKCVDKMTAVMAQAPQMALDVARRPASSVQSHMPAEPANVWSLSDALLCDVLSWLRGRDLVVAHCVSRRFARCAAVPTVVRAVALRAGLPAIIPLSYLQHEYGWMTLASMRTAFGGQLPEASVSSMSVCLIGEPSVGRHSFVHCLFVSIEIKAVYIYIHVGFNYSSRCSGCGSAKVTACSEASIVSMFNSARRSTSEIEDICAVSDYASRVFDRHVRCGVVAHY